MAAKHLMERLWVTEAGYPACVFLVHDGSHRCGYVNVPIDHPLYGVDHDEAYDRGFGDNIHGGLTYSGDLRLGDGDFDLIVEGNVIRVSQESPRFWYGFDCAHFGDEIHYPGKEEILKGIGPPHSPEHWWLEEEVVAECERLALQLKNYVPEQPNNSVGTSAGPSPP